MKEQKKDIYGIAKESNIDSNPDSKNFFVVTRATVGPKSSQGEKEKESITSRANSKQLKIRYSNCDVLTTSKLHELSSP